jgi:hypothetical protein
MGSTAPSLKKLMKTLATQVILIYQSSKHKADKGAAQKTTTRKKPRTKLPVPHVN